MLFDQDTEEFLGGSSNQTKPSDIPSKTWDSASTALIKSPESEEIPENLTLLPDIIFRDQFGEESHDEESISSFHKTAKNCWDYCRNFDMIYSSIGWVTENYLSVKGSISWGVNEVLPGLYLGDIYDAANLEKLKEQGISNIVCCILGTKGTFPSHLNYLVLPIKDMPHFWIRPFFETAFLFIEEALEKNKKVLVHCMKGQSRSAAIVLAFLMKFKKWRLLEATRYLQSKRPFIRPNKGFWRQLLSYDQELFEEDLNKN